VPTTRGETTPRPALILVHGAPGSGKSTLAHRLADELRFPLISRDGLKEVMAGYVPFESLTDSERFGLAAVGVFYHVVRALLTGDCGVVLDSAFPRGQAEDALAPLLPLARTIQVHCSVASELAARRYVERYERGDRHPCHFDAERIARVRSGARVIDWSRFDPLELSVPLVHVDTTDGYVPTFDAIVAAVRTGLAEFAEGVHRW